MKLIRIHFVFLLIGLLACNKEIDIDPPAYSRKIVVDGWIESNDYARIILTMSTPFLSPYDSAAIRASFLNYGKITLCSSKGESEVLTLFRDNNYFPPFIYRSINIKGEEGVTYKIKVEVSGHELSALTTIPEVPVINQIDFYPRSDSSGIIRMELFPDTAQINYFFVQTKSLKADNFFHPAYPAVFALQARSSAYLADIYRVREMNFYLADPEKDYYNKWPKWQFSLSDTVMVKVGTVDRQSFNVLQSIFEDRYNRENPFSFNGSGIKTNIEGGIGRWTGIAVSPIEVAMSKK